MCTNARLRGQKGRGNKNKERKISKERGREGKTIKERQNIKKRRQRKENPNSDPRKKKTYWKEGRKEGGKKDKKEMERIRVSAGWGAWV